MDFKSNIEKLPKTIVHGVLSKYCVPYAMDSQEFQYAEDVDYEDIAIDTTDKKAALERARQFDKLKRKWRIRDLFFRTFTSLSLNKD